VAESYDFQIDTLKFRAAISDKFPYARTTAPFRKEQFDAAATVGDQSLTGWWTRGQLSFHGGAGLKYYEVLDGDEVLNRFQSSDMVDVFEPGIVALSSAVGPLAAVVTGTTSAPIAVGPDIHPSGGTLLAAWVEFSSSTSWTLRRLSSGAVATVTPSQGSIAPYLAADSDYYYYVTNAPNAVEMAARGGTSGTQIYTHSTSILGLWAAKERLWVLDADGIVYALPPRPSSSTIIGSSHKVFSVVDGASSFDTWCFAAGPGPVYFGFKNRVYMVAVDDTGAVPALSTGIVVAQLPDGEAVLSMRFALGHLVLCTSMGLRAAVVQGDGSLIYGPLIAKGRGISKEMGTYGSGVYALLDDVEGEDPGVRLVRVDLEQLRPSGLVFAYSTYAAPLSYNMLSNNDTPGVSAGGGGVVVFGTDGTGAVLNRHERSGGERVTTGELLTGFHRFGTLEGKHFAGVKIRAEGTGGTVATYLLQQDGTETHLVTIDLATETGGEVSLVNNPPLEAAALRFVLSRDALDATNGPSLLGYQIKALPAPVRQRLLKWPLLMTDAYQDRYGVARGKRGGAWEAWQALENLEESDALVTYTDHRTGETGTAYIEQLELQTDTPSRGASSGFGGVGYVTLRKVG
jgi:hypothetical protein